MACMSGGQRGALSLCNDGVQYGQCVVLPVHFVHLWQGFNTFTTVMYIYLLRPRLWSLDIASSHDVLGLSM